MTEHKRVPCAAHDGATLMSQHKTEPCDFSRKGFKVAYGPAGSFMMCDKCEKQKAKIARFCEFETLYYCVECFIPRNDFEELRLKGLRKDAQLLERKHMTEHKLPDPPAYDPRIEQADAAEAMLAKRADIVWDLAINDGNGFVCALVLHYLFKGSCGLNYIESACEKVAIDLSVKGAAKFVPHDVRTALGLDD